MFVVTVYGMPRASATTFDLAKEVGAYYSTTLIEGWCQVGDFSWRAHEETHSHIEIHEVNHWS